MSGHGHFKHNHKVRTHDWTNGLLRSLDYLFETAEEALEFSKSVSASAVKIFDQTGVLVASRSMPNTPHELERLGYSGNEESYYYPEEDYYYPAYG